MNIKRFLLLLTALFLLTRCARVSSDDFQRIDDDDNAAETTTETPAAPRPIRPLQTNTTILADGQLTAINPALPLSFTVNGRLLNIRVNPGDSVNEGDLIATLDDIALRDSVTGAEQQVAQAEISLAQAQLSLDNLLEWEADEMAIALAEANLAVAEDNLAKAQTQDAASGSNLTSARVNVDQAQRGLADAQEAQTTAYDPGREWELGDPWRSDALKNEREAADRAVQQAEEGLEVARANYNLAAAGLNDNSALNADAAVVNAQQALHQAETGPKESEIAAARLQVEQAALSLEQSQFSLTQAQEALTNAALTAPWNGTVLSVDVSPGGMIGAGTAVVVLLDTQHLQFQTSNLSERDLAQIESGQEAQITLKTYPNAPIVGTVARIAPQADGAVGDAAAFAVIIDLEASDLTLRPGMTGRVEILSD